MKYLTNEEKVIKLMNHSKSGPMSQMMVMEALRFYFNMIVENGKPEPAPGAFVNPEAWFETATILASELKEFNKEVKERKKYDH